MNKHGKNTPVDVPKWDIALEALISDEYRRLQRPLSIGDFRRLGQAHKIRFHDIMATVYQLVRYGKWRHEARDEQGRPVDEQALQGLYDHGRLDEDAAERLAVSWAPR